MWYCPDKYEVDLPDANQEFLSMKGLLNDDEAKISLAKFLRANVGFNTELVSGIKLAPYQEITLKAMMNRNFSMCVWGRGCGKTFIASVFCFLQCIFNPGTKILVAGPTFRTARFIFNNLEKLVDSKGADLLAQCFGAKVKRNDQYEWQINGGTITAIPLNGEKIRGFRANILVLDEFLLLPEDIIKTVLMPFLVAPQNMKERIEIREIEDKLIEEGEMTEEDRMVFENDSKMVALSSASYTFENLFRTYKDWTENIQNDKPAISKYFISQLSFEALPEHMIDKTIIEEAQQGGQSHSSFQREYCAQFSDGSDSYFSAKKMHLCTVKDGDEPSTLIRGEKGKMYILGIDPSFSNSPTSDFFAMSVLEVEPESRTTTLVHSYAVAGGDLKDHIKYMDYLTESFDLEMIMIDNAGFQFIDSCNESEAFKEKQLSFIDFNSDTEGNDYEQMLRKAKSQYNKKSGHICVKQVFTTNWIRNANEHLQACIDHKRLWFSSRTTASEKSFNKQSQFRINLGLAQADTVLDFIETQDSLIYSTKKQCALVEVKTSPRGTQSFDLPQHLKRSTSENRARKDNYTTLLLSNWMAKCYFDMIGVQETKTETFSPFMLG
jgi:hypothetical protein